MKSWRKSIQFPAPLRQACLRPPEPTPHDRFQAALQESYERGKVDGERLLAEQLVQQRAEIRQLLDGVVTSLQGVVPQVVRDSEKALIDLTLELVRKMVAQIPVSREMVAAVVREALLEAEGSSEITVRLHAEDLELLGKTGIDALQPLEPSRRVQFLAAHDVARGGCLVETQFGILDARREAKLELLQESLKA